MLSIGEVIRIADERNFEVSWAESYGEPGYDAPKLGIVFANWNNPDRYNRETGHREEVNKDGERFCRIFEKMGFEIEWSDEWYTCDCGKAVRTVEDSYSWTPSYRIIRGELFCLECARDEDNEA